MTTSSHSIGLGIREKIENASVLERSEMLDSHYNKWVYDLDNIRKKYSREPTPVDFLNMAIENFNLDINNLQIGSFEKARLMCLSEMSYLRIFFDHEEVQENEEERPLMIRKFNKVFKSLIDAENAIRYTLHLQNSMIENEIGENEQLDITRYTPADTSNNTAYQNLLLFLLESLMRKGFRRYDGACYEKIYTEKGYDTHTWRNAMTIEKFIYEAVRKETHYEMWQNLTNSQNNVAASVKYLSCFTGGEFEDIKKDRNIFSFNNGIYITNKGRDSNGFYEDEWIPYDGPAYKKIGSSIISCNYFNLEFQDVCRPSKEPGHRYNNWFNIIGDKCPNFKMVMAYQEWSDEVQKWNCIMIGRLLYDVSKLDGWQVLSYYLGLAGTGKSSIINYIIKKIYEGCDIATMSNNIESKFGLGMMADKFLFIAPEIKSNFGLEQSEFQSLISGESVSVAVKNKTANTIDWKTPGIMAGNEVPMYSDNAGSISRRILVFLFHKKVKNGDTQLGSKLEKEIPDIIHACNRAYLEAVNVHGSEDIWTMVPPYFIESRNEMAETTNALAAFLKSDGIVLGTEYECREGEFVEAFNQYCKEMNIVKPRWSRQLCLGPFTNHDITVSKYTRKDLNKPVEVGAKKTPGTGTYLLNVGFSRDTEDNEIEFKG